MLKGCNHKFVSNGRYSSKHDCHSHIVKSHVYNHIHLQPTQRWRHPGVAYHVMQLAVTPVHFNIDVSFPLSLHQQYF